MVKKCCIPGCRGNYDAKNKVQVYRLPSNKEEQNRWINSIPRSNFPNKPDTIVCERHFLENLLKAHVNGKDRPIDPPLIFPNIPSSVIPLKPRSATKVLSPIRNEKCDELSQYLKSNLFTLISLCEDIKNHKFVCPVTTFVILRFCTSNQIPFMLTVYLCLMFISQAILNLKVFILMFVALFLHYLKTILQLLIVGQELKKQFAI